MRGSLALAGLAFFILPAGAATTGSVQLALQHTTSTTVSTTLRGQGEVTWRIDDWQHQLLAEVVRETVEDTGVRKPDRYLLAATSRHPLDARWSAQLRSQIEQDDASAYRYQALLVPSLVRVLMPGPERRLQADIGSGLRVGEERVSDNLRREWIGIAGFEGHWQPHPRWRAFAGSRAEVGRDSTTLRQRVGLILDPQASLWWILAAEDKRQLASLFDSNTSSLSVGFKWYF